MSRLLVGVIGGGRSCEHDVSLASAAAVAAALCPDRYDVLPLTVGRDGTWHGPSGPLGLLPAASVAAAVTLLMHCDVVFPAVHGPHGEDGELAALCELAGVPYVGSGVRAGAIAMDKWATKAVAAALGVGVAPARLVTRGDVVTWERPVVVKPVAAGSSHGVALVESPADLAGALAAAFTLDERVLVEDVVRGRELDVAVLAHADGSRQVSPVLEIRGGGIFDTARKYDGTADLVVPAAVDIFLERSLQRAAVTLFDAVGCAGVARIDFFATPEGLVLNEINTMPGLTACSQVPRMFVAAGLSYPDLLEVLVAAARGRRP